MELKEAVERLGDGHGLWKIEGAKEVCEAFGVPFDEGLIETFTRKEIEGSGGWMEGDAPEMRAVCGLELGRHIANKLGAEHEAHLYMGKGRQAREYQRAVEEKLKADGVLA